MGVEVVDISETERELQADMAPLESLDMNMVTRAKTVLFSTSKELASSATLGRASRALPCVRVAFVPVGGTAESGRHRCGGNHEISKEVCTRKKGNGLCSGARTRGIHITQPAP